MSNNSLYLCTASRLFAEKPEELALKVVEVSIRLVNDTYEPVDYSHLKTCGRIFVECENSPVDSVKGGLTWRRITTKSNCHPAFGCEKKCSAQKGYRNE